jgi:hypothetical protein
MEVSPIGDMYAHHMHASNVPNGVASFSTDQCGHPHRTSSCFLHAVVFCTDREQSCTGKESFRLLKDVIGHVLVLHNLDEAETILRKVLSLPSHAVHCSSTMGRNFIP